MFYEIQKGVPIPSKGLVGTIRKMEYGDSIVVPAGRHLGIHTCAHAAGAKVRTRSNKEDGTVTVWRIDRQEAAEPDAGASAGRTVFLGDPLPTAKAASPTPPPAQGGPVPEWPKIVKTRADPELRLPEGYYIRRGPYSAELWIQGSPPEGPYSPLEETVLDRHRNAAEPTDKTKSAREIFS